MGEEYAGAAVLAFTQTERQMGWRDELRPLPRPCLRRQFAIAGGLPYPCVHRQPVYRLAESSDHSRGLTVDARIALHRKPLGAT